MANPKASIVVVEGNEKLPVSQGPITRTPGRTLNGLGRFTSNLIIEPMRQQRGPVMKEIALLEIAMVL